jgi:hypothetical protein
MMISCRIVGLVSGAGLSGWKTVRCTPSARRTRALSDPHGVGVGGASGKAPAVTRASVVAVASSASNASLNWGARSSVCSMTSMAST